MTTDDTVTWQSDASITDSGWNICMDDPEDHQHSAADNAVFVSYCIILGLGSCMLLFACTTACVIYRNSSAYILLKLDHEANMTETHALKKKNDFLENWFIRPNELTWHELIAQGTEGQVWRGSYIEYPDGEVAIKKVTTLLSHSPRLCIMS